MTYVPPYAICQEKKYLREVVPSFSYLIDVQRKGVAPQNNKEKKIQVSVISSMPPLVSRQHFTSTSTQVFDMILALYPQLRNTFHGYSFVYFLPY